MKLSFILAALAGIILALWYVFGNAGATDQSGQTNSLLGALRGTNSLDPVTKQSNGLLNGLDQWFISESNPGGGEVAGSSETYTGAVTTILSDPWGSLKSIVGYGQN